MHKDMTLKDVLIRFKPFYKKYKKEFAIAIFGMILTSMKKHKKHKFMLQKSIFILKVHKMKF